MINKFFAPAAFALTILSGCLSTSNPNYELIQRSEIISQIDIVRQDVIVPAELTVSEANAYFPNADIVWREDPIGDRHMQVRRIVDDAMKWGLAAFNEGRKAAVTVEVQKFHALTEKARYTVGGVHAIRLQVLVWDISTGNPIYGPVLVDADLNALGGEEALLAEAEGRTQKARITQHLAGTIQQVLLNAGLAKASVKNGQ